MNIFWFLKPKVTYTSSIHGTITIGTRDKNKALFSGGVTQSGGEIQPMWDEVIKKLYTNHSVITRSKATKQSHILLLGVGGGSVIHAIRQFDTKATITGIELDPVMKQVAIEQFGIKENKKLKIIIADAIDFLMNQTKPQEYDLIIVDLYIGPLNPPQARTKKFMNRLKTVLKPKGSILYNAHYQKTNVKDYELFLNQTKKLFHVVAVIFSYPLNRVLSIEN